MLAGALLLLSGCGGGVFDPASAKCDAPPSTFGKSAVLSDHVEIPVHFTCEGAVLGGTLYLPRGAGAHPALVWVHAAGEATRLSWGTFLRPFVQAGFAIFSFDKRGVGESEGIAAPATMGTSTSPQPTLWARWRRSGRGL